jgi:hypothetical protein
MQGFPSREVGEVLNEPVDLIIDGGILPVGTDLVLPIPPEVIHRVELGRPLRQPDQLGIRPGCQLLGGPSGVAAILVQQQGDMPTPVMVMDQSQERLKVLGPLMLSGQEQPRARAEIHCPEDHSAGISAAQEDFLGRSPQRPAGPQGRKQQQIGLILSQQNASGTQAPDLTADAVFFFSHSGSGASA